MNSKERDENHCCSVWLGRGLIEVTLGPNGYFGDREDFCSILFWCRIESPISAQRDWPRVLNCGCHLNCENLISFLPKANIYPVGYDVTEQTMKLLIFLLL